MPKKFRGKSHIGVRPPETASRGRWQSGKVGYRPAKEVPANRAQRRAQAKAEQAKARAIERNR